MRRAGVRFPRLGAPRGKDGSSAPVARTRIVGAADLMLLGTVLIWGFDFTAAKFALTHGLQPLVYSCLRFTAGAALFSLLTYRRERTLRTATRRDLVVLVAAGLVGVWLNQVAFINGLQLTTASTGALVYGALPAMTAVVAFLAGLERPSRRFWLASAVSFGGVALVAAGSGGKLSGDVGGVLLMLAATATWAVYSVLIAPLLQRYSAWRISALVLIVGCVPLLASGSGQLASQGWSIRPLAWAALVYGCLAALVAGNVLWFGGVHRVGPSRATLFANLGPFVGAVIALLVLSEHMTALQWAGGATIAAGLAVARYRGRAART